ncbi:hypothetical protein NQ318_011601 [Aromia moschata]|uniref:Transposase n=1 Tax=Aromia moschata TaxID=1265417 RepID=A0AAV8Z734_9CUCU|nr:hypothetical protein NQ318_011601 [Aromia moschata]
MQTCRDSKTKFVLFNELYSNRSIINHSTLSRLAKHIAMCENPIQSFRALATTFDISRQSVKKLFKREQLGPYKLQLVHEINEDDFDRICNKTTKWSDKRKESFADLTG